MARDGAFVSRRGPGEGVVAAVFAIFTAGDKEIAVRNHVRNISNGGAEVVAGEQMGTVALSRLQSS